MDGCIVEGSRRKAGRLMQWQKFAPLAGSGRSTGQDYTLSYFGIWRLVTGTKKI